MLGTAGFASVRPLDPWFLSSSLVGSFPWRWLVAASWPASVGGAGRKGRLTPVPGRGGLALTTVFFRSFRSGHCPASRLCAPWPTIPLPPSGSQVNRWRAEAAVPRSGRRSCVGCTKFGGSPGLGGGPRFPENVTHWFSANQARANAAALALLPAPSPWYRGLSWCRGQAGEGPGGQGPLPRRRRRPWSRGPAPSAFPPRRAGAPPRNAAEAAR
jgi:hypothetical protein